MKKIGGEQEKKASGGAYYMAVTLLWCSSEWERLSTHYSSDLGGQLEESNINQSVAQAEEDDSKQQCSKQPLHLPHPHPKPSTPLPAPPLALCTYKSTSLHIYVQSSSALSPSLFLLYCCLFSLFLAPHPPSPPPPPPSYALKSLWISSYKQWINPSPPCVNGPLNTSLCL